jgi:hypothetical protein
MEARMNKQSAVYYRLTKLGRSLAYALGVVILSLAAIISSGTPVIAAPNDSSYDQVIQIMHLGIPEYAYKGERMKDSAYAGTVIALTQTGKVYAWGNNMYGKVGIGAECTIVEQGSVKITAEKKPPCYYDKPQDLTKYFGGEKVVKLSSYEGYVAVAITESGKLYYWGWRYDWKKDEQHNTPHLDPSMSGIHTTGMTTGWPSIAWDDRVVYDMHNNGRPKDGLRSPQSYSYSSNSLPSDVTIREADFTTKSGNSQNYGAWALTSKNKLLMIRHDGTTYEATNETVAKHGGIKHVGFNYAIDNQGKMWAYYYGKTPAALEDISANMIGTIPAMRDIVGTKEMVLRSTDGRFYTINLGFMDKDGNTYGKKKYELLLEMSLSTLRRKVIKLAKKRGLARGISSTKSANALKQLVPTFKGNYADKGLGYGELDTVVHCGSKLVGVSAYSLVYVDMATYWTEPVAQYNKTDLATLHSIQQVAKRLPWRIKGLHPDSGSEFINQKLIAYCKRYGIELTRSRPSKKNDNCHVEERNNHVIRKYPDAIFDLIMFKNCSESVQIIIETVEEYIQESLSDD